MVGPGFQPRQEAATGTFFLTMQNCSFTVMAKVTHGAFRARGHVCT